LPFEDQLFSYVSRRFDDGVLVDADEVYAAFQLQFDNFYPVEMIDQVIQNFANIHDLTDVTIECEGVLT
jgi:hypothetical protein